MTALSTNRDTKERSGVVLSLPVAAAVTLFAGALVAVDANGNATPGATATTLKGVGRAEREINNASGSAGDKHIEVRRGVFAFANSAAADEITRADINADCYIVDDQTVAKTDGTGTRSVAGKVFDVDAQGVWVDFS